MFNTTPTSHELPNRTNLLSLQHRFTPTMSKIRVHWTSLLSYLIASAHSVICIEHSIYLYFSWRSIDGAMYKSYNFFTRRRERVRLKLVFSALITLNRPVRRPTGTLLRYSNSGGNIKKKLSHWQRLAPKKTTPRCLPNMGKGFH